MIPAWLSPDPLLPLLRKATAHLPVRENSERAELERMNRRIKERMRAEELAKKLEKKTRPKKPKPVKEKKPPRVKMTKQQKALAECARLGETMEQRRKRLQAEWYARHLEKRRANSLAYYHRTKKLASTQQRAESRGCGEESSSPLGGAA